VDAAGNGVSNRAVSWVVATGGGNVDPVTSTTNADGRASTGWTLGPGEGSNTLNAVVSGVGVVGFSAAATNGGGGGGTAQRLEFLVQPTDTEEDDRISPAVEVVVLDQSGNRMTDREFEVNLELIREGRGRQGSLRGDRSQRTQAGVARFPDLEVDRDGDYRLRASADGLPSIQSNRFEVEDD
jgi:adhesin/invasin